MRMAPWQHSPCKMQAEQCHCVLRLNVQNNDMQGLYTESMLQLHYSFRVNGHHETSYHPLKKHPASVQQLQDASHSRSKTCCARMHFWRYEAHTLVSAIVCGGGACLSSRALAAVAASPCNRCSGEQGSLQAPSALVGAALCCLAPVSWCNMSITADTVASCLHSVACGNRVGRPVLLSLDCTAWVSELRLLHHVLVVVDPLLVAANAELLYKFKIFCNRGWSYP